MMALNKNGKMYVQNVYSNDRGSKKIQLDIKELRTII